MEPQREYVGIDLHRRRSVIVRRGPDGEVLDTKRIDNDPAELMSVVAEIGDASRFRSPDQLSAWAGLTPRHRESDTTVRRGHITKQGSRLVRWAAVEAVARQKGATPIRAHHHRVADRRGKAIGRVAAARKLLTLVYYGLRDGEVRCLAEAG